MVSSMGKNLTANRLEVCSKLWQAGIKAETLYVENIRTDKMFSFAFDNRVPLILIIGEEELKNGIYKIRSLNENKEYEFTKEELVPKVLELVAANPVLLAKDNKAEESKTESKE